MTQVLSSRDFFGAMKLDFLRQREKAFCGPLLDVLLLRELTYVHNINFHILLLCKEQCADLHWITEALPLNLPTAQLEVESRSAGYVPTPLL